MSLMIASICSPERAICSAHSRCPSVKSHVEQQLGHPDHAVHRGTNLVAQFAKNADFIFDASTALIPRQPPAPALARFALRHVLAEAHPAFAPAEDEVVTGDLDIDDRPVLATVSSRAACRRPQSLSQVGQRVLEHRRVVLLRRDVKQGSSQELLAGVAGIRNRGVGDGDDPQRLTVDASIGCGLRSNSRRCSSAACSTARRACTSSAIALFRSVTSWQSTIRHPRPSNSRSSPVMSTSMIVPSLHRWRRAPLTSPGRSPLSWPRRTGPSTRDPRPAVRSLSVSVRNSSRK